MFEGGGYGVGVTVTPADARSDHAPQGISEFFADELALVLGCSRTEATTLTEVSETLVTRLRATWAALATANSTSPGLAGWPGNSAGRPAARTPHWWRRSKLPCCRLPPICRSPGYARQPTGNCSVGMPRRRTGAGTGRSDSPTSLSARPAMGWPNLVRSCRSRWPPACRETVDTYARVAKADGDSRPIGQLRTGVLADPTSGRLRATVTRLELERLARRGCPDHQHRSGPVPIPVAPGRFWTGRPHRSVRTHPGSAPLRQGQGSHVPSSGLPQPGGMGRPRPRGGARGRRRDRLHQPLLLVPPPSPDQDARRRLVLRHVR